MIKEWNVVMTDIAGNAGMKIGKSIELIEIESRIMSESKIGSGNVSWSVSTRTVTTKVTSLVTASVITIETVDVT